MSYPPSDLEDQPRLRAVLISDILCEACDDVVAVELEDGAIRVVVYPLTDDECSMTQSDDAGLDVAALLVSACSSILADAIDDLGRDVDTGEYISQAAVDEVHGAIRFAMPTMPAHDRRLFGTGKCTGWPRRCGS